MKKLIRIIIDTIIIFESGFYSAKRKDQKKKVLILRKDGLGDCILFYPLLKEYRDYYNEYEITLIYPKYFKDLSPILNNLADKIIWFDHKMFSKNFFYRRGFLLDLKKAGYDISIYPVYSRENIGDQMIKITNAKEKIGFDGDGYIQGENNKNKGNKIYSKLIKIPKNITREFDRNIYFAEQIINRGIIINFPTIDINKLPVNQSEKLVKENKLTDKRFVIVFPGSGANYKIWPINRFANCIDFISKNNLTPVICGSKREVDLSNKIINECKNKEKIVNLTGKTDLCTLSHMISKSRFYFGSDTSILHLSIALSIPTIAIIGSGSFGRFFPYADENKNIALYDKASINKYPNDIWEKKYINDSRPHPSIEAIGVDSAIEKINTIIYDHN